MLKDTARAWLSKVALTRPKALFEASINRIQSPLESEKTWHDFMANNSPPEDIVSRYIRLNLPLDRDLPDLADVSVMDNLKTRTRSYLAKERGLVPAIIHRLIASSFYLCDVDYLGSTEDDTADVEVMSWSALIKCRFIPKSLQLRQLGQHLRSRCQAHTKRDDYHRHQSQTPYFTISERSHPQSQQVIPLGIEIMDAMINEGRFEMEQLRFELRKSRNGATEAEAVVYLYLGWEEDEHGSDVVLPERTEIKGWPISGFPRSLEKHGMSTD